MRRVSCRTLLAGVALVLAACGNSGPDAVARSFVEAMVSGEVDVAVSHLSAGSMVMGRDKTRSMLQSQSNSVRREVGNTRLRYKVRSRELNDDRATVVLAVYSGRKLNDEVDIDLVRENGVWKVDLGGK